MGTLRAILHEIIGLFVDDESLALALVLGCAGIGAAMVLVPGLPVPLAAALLLAGCVVILLLNVLHAARRRRTATAGG
jgi:Flp pilus assembly protein TadB